MKVYIDFYVIVIQPINVGEKKRQGMMFTIITQAKDLNGLRFQLSFSYKRYEKITNIRLSFSYNQYEKMTKLTRVTIRIVKENILRLITMKTIYN